METYNIWSEGYCVTGGYIWKHVDENSEMEV